MTIKGPRAPSTHRKRQNAEPGTARTNQAWRAPIRSEARTKWRGCPIRLDPCSRRESIDRGMAAIVLSCRPRVRQRVAVGVLSHATSPS